MRKKLKGSALLWSVCALLIVVFVLTGLLALNKAYAGEEINNIASRRAEYLARSGVEITADLIENGRLVRENDILVGEIDILTLVVSSEAEKKDDGAGAAKEEKQLEVTYDLDGTEVKVTVERTGDEVLTLKSFAASGYMNKTVTGVLVYNEQRKKWELEGYATK